MRSRAQEFIEAQRLRDLALATMESSELPPLGDRALTAELYLRAALVSAGLAGAGPGVEHDARALAAKPSQAERQAARPPLHPTPGLGQPGPHDDRPKPHPPLSAIRDRL